jgi:hypothetical protein
VPDLFALAEFFRRWRNLLERYRRSSPATNRSGQGASFLLNLSFEKTSLQVQWNCVFWT